METDQKFWIVIWSLCAASIVTVVALIGFFHVQDNARGYAAVRTLIEKGVSPIAAGCAIWGIPSDSAGGSACVMTAAQAQPAGH